jgi:hypothetical protein
MSMWPRTRQRRIRECDRLAATPGQNHRCVFPRFSERNVASPLVKSAVQFSVHQWQRARNSYPRVDEAATEVRG